MKSHLATAIANRDAGALTKIAQDSTPQKIVSPQAEQLVDVLFRNLKQIFPAAVNTIFKNESDELAAKRQWIAAFAENGITTREQLQNGMRHARASDSPFSPQSVNSSSGANRKTLLSSDCPRKLNYTTCSRSIAQSEVGVDLIGSRALVTGWSLKFTQKCEVETYRIQRL